MIRTVGISWSCWFLTCLAATAVAQLPPNPVAPRPSPAQAIAAQVPVFRTRQTAFAIPFTVDRRIAQPVEVHLYVSNDGGNRWRLYDRQLPTARQFTFRARGDGEYWFASRTVDAGNRAGADGALRPELRVIVDTVEPQFKFTARPGQGGQVITSWHVYDQNLDPASLKVEYQEEMGYPWKPVAVRVPNGQSVNTQLEGQNAWWPNTQSPTINIRAEVRDLAGNRVVVNRRLLLPSVAAEQPAARGRSGIPMEPFARRGGRGEGAIAWPSDNAADRPQVARRVPNASTSPGFAAPRRGSEPRPRSNRPALPSHAAVAARMASTRSEPTRSEPTGPGSPLPLPPDVSTSLPPLPAAVTQGANSNDTPWSSTKPLPESTPVSESVPSQRPSGPAVNPVSSSVPRHSPSDLANDGPIIAPSAADTSSLFSSANNLPPGERPQMTNSSRFQLDYDVDSVGPSGVAEVQLWATEDAGQSWRLWGTDDDVQSPFDVAVEREGIYGFQVVIVANNGLSGARPQSGDPADIWVGVDSTNPSADLTGAIYGQGQHAGQLIIQWRAEDANLGGRPVSLLFGESLSGPWTVIASALPNDGEYAWRADPQLPPRVYIRLEVRDQAGNVAFDQTSDPIRIDGLAPKARIRGIMPLHDQDREAFRRPRRR